LTRKIAGKQRECQNAHPIVRLSTTLKTPRRKGYRPFHTMVITLTGWTTPDGKRLPA
jgi:hypothetical protein